MFSLLHGNEPLSGGTEHVGLGGIGGGGGIVWFAGGSGFGDGSALQATPGLSGQPPCNA